MRRNSDRAKPYLTGIFLENFQSLRTPAYIRMAGITMLYGPNSAGKSSILDALDFIRKINDDDDNNFRTVYLWRTLCSDDTRLGISYRAMPIKETDGTRQSSWIEREVNYSSPHIDFFDELKNKEVFIEFSQGGDTIKVGVEGKPLFEIHGFFQRRPYNEDFTPAISDEEVEDAENCDREIKGRLTVYHENPHLPSLLPDLQRFYLVASRQQGRRTAISKSTFRWKTKKIENSQDLQMIFEDNGSSFSIRGIELVDESWRSGNRRFAIDMDYEADKYLRKTDLKENSKIQKKIALTGEQSTRLWLLDQLKDISQLIDVIVEGLRYQVCVAIKHSRVPGNRGVINSDVPAYATKGFGYSQLVSESQNLSHVALYAEARSEYSKSLKNVYKEDPMGGDFINEALTRYMSSLNGYRVNADVHMTKPKFKNKARLHPWHSHNKNSLVFLNVQDSSGRILGFQEVGSGISYILPIFTSLWASTLSFVEQPELHLHPAAQCELGDVFVAAKNLGSFSVIESHSEHLLLRILRRIRETTAGTVKDKSTTLSCDELKIYYFNPSPGQGTSVYEIRVDRFGELLNRWPGGFFAERDQELFS
jgi:AAA ATPase domain